MVFVSGHVFPCAELWVLSLFFPALEIKFHGIFCVASLVRIEMPGQRERKRRHQMTANASRTAKHKKRFCFARNARESGKWEWEWPGVRAMPLPVQKFLLYGGPGVFILDPDDSPMLSCLFAMAWYSCIHSRCSILILILDSLVAFTCPHIHIHIHIHIHCKYGGFLDGGVWSTGKSELSQLVTNSRQLKNQFT